MEDSTKSNNLSEKLQEINLKKLKQSAIDFPTDNNFSETLEEVCQSMADISFKANKPVKSVFDGKEFVIDANTLYSKVLGAYCDQCMMLDEKPFDVLKDCLDKVKDERELEIKSKPNFNDTLATKAAEVIIKKYPQKVDELDTINLLDVYLANFGTKDNSKIEGCLKKSVTKYMSGADTFEPSLYNVSSLPDLQDFMYKSGMYDMKDIDKRIEQTEKKMIKFLNGKKLNHCSDASLSFIGQAASKYPDYQEAKELKSKSLEVVMNKLARGHIFNPKTNS